MFNPDFNTSGNEVVEEFRSRVDGRVFVITGASLNGLGAETAISLAASATPRLLVLVGRSLPAIQPVLDSIRASNASVQAEAIALDLASQASVRAGASKILQLIDEKGGGKLDVLINNAGVMVPPYTETADGLELQFGVNHIGHFILTKYLLPKLQAARGSSVKARIVNVSSGGHHFSGIRFDDLGFQEGGSYNPWIAYGQSKTANILFTRRLARKLKEKGILSYSLNPGSIKSPLQRYITEETFQQLQRLTNGAYKPTYKTLQQGCSTTLIAALSPAIEDDSGAYLDNCQIAEAAAFATDPAIEDKLWKISEEITNEEFHLSV